MLETGEVAPVGHKRVSGDVIFHVKMDFARKVRLVLDRHRIPSSKVSSHSGVVSRESFRIAFTRAALKDSNYWDCDIQNVCLQAPTA